ncbi:MAG: DNA mismatch repair endonuclease MutL [Thermomicrobiales bacterium]|nr:DNA mismatch repair endonuclease MutL [Thermomicrobiales bacterium]
MPIQLLDNETIGKIAAGEVVERPASVVKELIENSIDAQATRITVSIEAGGTRSIEVVDNGAGMTPDELPLALQRHATSKLTEFDDLDLLHTLGFRGEALPSIAAVASVRVQSRPAGSQHGGALRVEFGAVGATEPAGGDTGTTVQVRDLFENVPARRKFQRQPSTESGLIVRLVSAYAAAYPQIAFTLIVDGRRSFVTTGSGDLIEAAATVYGNEVGRAAIELVEPEFDARVPGVTVSGWLCAPTITRSHRQQMVFLMNGRQIQSRTLMYALEEAYHTLLMVGRHPVTLVRIDVEPDQVDVNVHPTKAEVKFADERAVARAISRAAHATLSRIPRAEPPRIRIESSMPLSPTYVPSPMPAVDARPFPQTSMQNPPERPTEPVREAPDPVPEYPRPNLPVLRVLGQVASTYIIAEGPEGLYLIDQHAAHERVVYERFLGQMVAAGVERQPMLDPLVLDLSPEESTVIEQSMDELGQLGFELERFGPNSILVRSVPSVAVGTDIEARLRDILNELGEGGAGSSWLDSVAVSVACHTSIRAGQTLSLQEMRELVEQLERTEQPRACGHGRPTMLKLTQDELERQFGRT